MRHQAFHFLQTWSLVAGAALLTSSTLLINPAWSQDDPSLLPPHTTLSVDLGWEHLWLGDVIFGGKYDYEEDPSELVTTNQLQDGGFDGVRIDLSLRRATPFMRWPDAVVGLKGFMPGMTVPAPSSASPKL